MPASAAVRRSLGTSSLVRIAIRTVTTSCPGLAFGWFSLRLLRKLPCIDHRPGALALLAHVRLHLVQQFPEIGPGLERLEDRVEPKVETPAGMPALGDRLSEPRHGLIVVLAPDPGDPIPDV